MLGISSFLVLIWLFGGEELELGSSPCQALVHRKRFDFGKLVAFSVAEILPVQP